MTPDPATDRAVERIRRLDPQGDPTMTDPAAAVSDTAESPDCPLSARLPAAGAGSGTTEPANACEQQSVIREIGIIRDLQPTDVLVLTVPRTTNAEACHRLGEMARAQVPCKVLIVSDDVTVGCEHRGCACGGTEHDPESA